MDTIDSTKDGSERGNAPDRRITVRLANGETTFVPIPARAVQLMSTVFGGREGFKRCLTILRLPSSLRSEFPAACSFAEG
jgi:hypothetical protein